MNPGLLRDIAEFHVKRVFEVGAVFEMNLRAARKGAKEKARGEIGGEKEGDSGSEKQGSL